MLGGLYRYLREADPRHFQPMNANFGLVAPLGEGQTGGGAEGQKRLSKEQRKERIVARATEDFGTWVETL
jgi:methylenetetrahydrofolate--tRNA-(uracil-5-)-methyltransferase